MTQIIFPRCSELWRELGELYVKQNNIDNAILALEVYLQKSRDTNLKINASKLVSKLLQQIQLQKSS